MEHKASAARSDLAQMLLDETAEPKALPLSLLQDITGDFSDDQEIGSGGFAVVYKGILGDRAVAVKRLSKAYMHEAEFHREVECLMRVKHKNVVRFLGYCADTQGNMERYNGKLVMADVHQRLLCFEYIPKGGLDKYIIDAYREWGTCYKIIKGICEGLQYLHENHIIHLDLKPANILLDNNMVPKITDFGLSRCFEENQSWDITKTILGTMGYLAPEFRDGGVITRGADLYSLGVVIIEILTGQKGYQPIGDVLESWSDKLERSQRDKLRQEIRVCYETALECRDFNPAKRPSARDIIDRLHEMESIQSCSTFKGAEGDGARRDRASSGGAIGRGASTFMDGSRLRFDKNPEAIISKEQPKNFSCLRHDDLRAYLQSQQQPAHVGNQQQIALLREAMSTPVLTATEEQTLEEVESHFETVSGFPVVDSTLRCVGVVVKRDRARALHGSKTKIAEVMTCPAITLESDKTVTDAATLMLKKKIHRLPIVNQDNQVIGIVTRNDALRVLEATPKI